MRLQTIAAAAYFRFINTLVAKISLPYLNWKTNNTLSVASSTAYIYKIIRHKDRLICVTAGAKLYTSDDQGETWVNNAQFSSVRNPATNMYDIDSDGTNIYACGNYGKVIKSVDDGVTWTAVGNINSLATTPGIQFIKVINGRIWVGWGGKIAISDDGGITFSLHANASAAFGTTQPTCIFVFKGLYIVVGSNKCMVSQDGGNTWALATSFPAISIPMGAVLDNVAVVVGTAGKSSYSYDGLTWYANTALAPVVDSENQLAVVSDSFKIVSVGNNNSTAVTFDGLAWEPLPTPPISGGHWATVNITPDMFIMGGTDGEFGKSSSAPSLQNEYKEYRIAIEMTNGDSYAQMYEVELLNASGVDLLVPGSTIPTSSSNYSSSFGPDKLIDNDVSSTGSKWTSAGNQGAGSWVAFNLAAPANVKNLTITAFTTAQAARQPKNFRLEGKNDNGDWDTLVRRIGETNWGQYEKRTYPLL